MIKDPVLAELLTLWPRLTDEARQSLLRIARAKVAWCWRVVEKVVPEDGRTNG